MRTPFNINSWLSNKMHECGSRASIDPKWCSLRPCAHKRDANLPCNASIESDFAISRCVAALDNDADRLTTHTHTHTHAHLRREQKRDRCKHASTLEIHISAANVFVWNANYAVLHCFLNQTQWSTNKGQLCVFLILSRSICQHIHIASVCSNEKYLRRVRKQ